MVSATVPDAGDLIWLNFSPQAGREQGGTRPALVVTPKFYNELARLALCCPVTSKVKDYPYEVILPQSVKTRGVILVDHVKSVDFTARVGRFIERVPEDTLELVRAKLESLLQPDKA